MKTNTQKYFERLRRSRRKRKKVKKNCVVVCPFCFVAEITID